MRELDVLRDLLADSFTRVAEVVEQLTEGLDVDAAAYRPDPEANSVAWLLWHLARVEDDHVADLAGAEQVWPAWRERFALPFPDDETGYGQSAAEVGQVRVGGDLLGGYYADVHAATLRYVATVDADRLAQVVDDRWDPPVTASVRLVSVLGDITQHVGQAAYVAGLAKRAAGGAAG
jgi:hypothetical protein